MSTGPRYGIITSSGSAVIASGQCASLRAATYSFGNTIFASISGGSGIVTVPGQVVGLISGASTVNTLAISWAPPISGGSPSALYGASIE